MLALGAELVQDIESCGLDAAESRLSDALASGAAREKYREMVAAQDGDPDAEIEVAPVQMVEAEDSGYISALDGEVLGQSIVDLGGGRRRLDQQIDHRVGLRVKVRPGDLVECGQPLVEVFAQPAALERVQQRLLQAFDIGTEKPTEEPLVVDRLVG